MQLLVNELALLIKNGVWVTALNTSLLIPDICCSLENKDGRTDGKRYKNWVNRYFSKRYQGLLQGEDIYKLRCASLHQGKLNHDDLKNVRLLFQIPGGKQIHHCNLNVIQGQKIIELNIGIFCYDIVESYNEWVRSNKDNPIISENLKDGINLYQHGLFGVPGPLFA